MRLLLALAFLLSYAISANTKIRTLAVSDLVAQAELIVIAEVVSIGETGSQMGPRIRNQLRVDRILKGKHPADKSIVLDSHYKPGEKAREDSIVFPPQGRRVLLFLKTTPGGRLILVNGIQGVWPLEHGTDKTLGMGFRYSIGEIENLIAFQRK